jgi:hypothetical protein
VNHKVLTTEKARHYVKAIDKNGVLIREEWVDDPIAADGFAAGFHVQYESDAWVDDVQVFSHLTPMKRLIPSVIDQ